MLGRHGVPPMTRFAIILWRVAVLVAAAAASGGVVSLVFAQDLTVRLIDGNDGKPYKNRFCWHIWERGPEFRQRLLQTAPQCSIFLLRFLTGYLFQWRMGSFMAVPMAVFLRTE